MDRVIQVLLELSEKVQRVSDDVSDLKDKANMDQRRREDFEANEVEDLRKLLAQLRSKKPQKV